MSLLKSRVKQAFAVSGIGLAMMLVGAITQVYGNRAYQEMGMNLHWYGALVLWISTLFLLFAVSGRENSSLPHRLGSLTLDPAQSADATLESAYKRFDGRFGRITLAGIPLTRSLLDLLSHSESISELDLTQAQISDEILDELESLKQVETMRLSPQEFEPRRLRMLQIALPACQISLADGTPVDLYGSIHTTELQEVSEAPKPSLLAS